MSHPTHATDATARILEGLRDLLHEICRRRPDGAQLLAELGAARTLHVVFDESHSVLAIGRRLPDGSLAWLDSVATDPGNRETFGRTPDEILGAASSVTH